MSKKTWWVVQTMDVNGEWYNTVTDTDENGVSTPVKFGSKADAMADLDSMMKEMRKANMPFNDYEFRIIPIEEDDDRNVTECDNCKKEMDWDDCEVFNVNGDFVCEECRQQWLNVVDYLLKKHYGININDTEIDTGDDCGAPYEVVNWWADETDLDRIDLGWMDTKKPLIRLDQEAAMKKVLT